MCTYGLQMYGNYEALDNHSLQTNETVSRHRWHSVHYQWREREKRWMGKVDGPVEDQLEIHSTLDHQVCRSEPCLTLRLTRDRKDTSLWVSMADLSRQNKHTPIDPHSAPTQDRSGWNSQLDNNYIVKQEGDIPRLAKHVGVSAPARFPLKGKVVQ